MVQELTIERDEARARLRRMEEATAGEQVASELEALRREKQQLELENANMFSIQAQNEALVAELRRLRGEPGPATCAVSSEVP